MASLKGISSPSISWTPHSSKDKEITPWSTPQKHVRNGKDIVMDVTYTVKNMETPPVAVLVQPNSKYSHPQSYTQPVLESGPVAKKHVNRSHDIMSSVANLQVSPQNALSVLPSSPTIARACDFVPTTPHNAHRTTPNSLTLHEISRKHHSPKLSESGHISLSELLTTAEATTQALNVAFQKQEEKESIHAESPQPGITATNVSEGVDSIPSQTSALGVHPQHSNLNGELQRLTVAEPKEHYRKLNNNLVEQHQSGPSSETKTDDLRGQSSTQFSPSRTTEKGKSPKRYIIQAVVIEECRPHHTGLVSPKRRAPHGDSQSAVNESALITKTGPPKFIKTRRPKQDIKILRSEEEVERYFQANIAPSRFVTKDELQAEVNATITNVEILTCQWKSRPPVQKLPRAPPIIYPTSQPLERFVDGIESAFGPGALARIPQKRPKRVLNHTKYLYTSSESEETDIEQSSDLPAEEDELVDRDIAMEEEPPIVPDMVQDWKEETKTHEDGAVNGPRTLKRKLSASEDEDSRKHPRLQDGVSGTKLHRPGMRKFDKDAIAKWVASLEVLVKGKVKMSRQDLRKLRQILDQVYNMKNALSIDDRSPHLEISLLKNRIRQLSEMAAEDIPFNDDENIRQKARMISRSWI